MSTPFVIERSRVIPVPREQVMPHLVDFRRWQAWSPWEGLDADLDRSYDGAPIGEGARYSWAGRKAGSGTMEIIGVTDDTVTIRLVFTKPFKAENATVFHLATVPSGTEVTWRMSGERGAVGNLFTRVLKMDAKIAGDFDKGLADLETAARS